MSADACRSEEATDRPGLETLPLPCPHCGQATESLKRYRLIDLLLFLFVAASVRHATYAACPPCMRKLLLGRTLLNVLTANLLSPIVIVLHAVYFLMSFTKGHSGSVLKILRGEQ